MNLYKVKYYDTFTQLQEDYYVSDNPKKVIERLELKNTSDNFIQIIEIVRIKKDYIHKIIK